MSTVAERDVSLDDGSLVGADHVVVATEGPAAAQLLGSRLPEPTAPGRGTVSVTYVAERSPVDAPDLILDTDGNGPVNNLTVLSDVAPSYAPGGGALISASVGGLPAGTDAELDAQARVQLTGWYGPDVAGWRHLATHRIAHAQPRQDVADLPSLAREVRLGPSTWACGDHRDTASIQGALVSGRRTADAILATSRSGPVI